MNKTPTRGGTLTREQWLILIETAVVLLLLFIKTFFFNRFIRLRELSFPFAALTVAIFALLCLIPVLLRFRPSAVTFSVYSFLCLCMLIDSVYYSYMNRLPSVAALKLIHQVTDISDTVLDLINFFSVSLVIDLPLWFFYAHDFRPRLLRGSAPSRHASHPVLGGVLSGTVLFGLLCLVIGLVSGTIRLSYLKNELFTYHVTDFSVLVEKERSIDEVDFDDYHPAPCDPSSPYYGIAAGRNVITVQVEAMQNFVLGLTYNGQEVTPFLNRLITEDTFYFDHYYYVVGGGNTADAEFSANNSLYAPDQEAAYIRYESNRYYGLPLLLKDNGYTGAYAFHGYKASFWNRENAYVAQGYDDFISGEDLTVHEQTGLGITDEDFFDQVIDYMSALDTPFYSFLVTLSSHHPYDIADEYRYLTLRPEDENTLHGDYLQSMRYVDHCLETFFEGLREAGLYENSVISIYGDHFGLPDYDAQSYAFMSDLLGHPYNEADIYNIPLIVHVPGSGIRETISRTGSHVDYYPTMLHLLGLSNTKSVMFGQDLFCAEQGIVYEEMHMARGSFIDDSVIYAIPMSGITLYTKMLDRDTGASLVPTGREQTVQKAHRVYKDCMAILDADAVIPSE